jgi:hypothetical protein
MAIISSVPEHKRTSKGSGNPITNLAYGFGVTKNCIQITDKRVLARNNNATRKRRSDAGENVFTSNKKRAAVFTPLHYYKKWRRLNAPGEVFDDLELASEFKSLNEMETQQFEEGAASFQEQGPYLTSEVGRYLRLTNGRITWRQMETSIGGGDNQVKPVSHVTIMTYVMSLPDSTYTSTRIFPMLTAQSKMFRKRWAIAWHLFWEGAKCVAQAVQFVLFQDDEKWFYSLVVRTHNKMVPMLGCVPDTHSVHHKCHIGKVMCLVTTAFAPHNNNFETGGRAYKVDCVRIGGMVKAKKDSYRRVYRNDGTYHYPKIPENILRREGEKYFESWEIQGVSEGTAKNPKFSLLKYKQERLKAKLDALKQQITHETGKIVVLYGQTYNAPPTRLKN